MSDVRQRNVEFEAQGDDNKLEGYFAVYNVETDLGWFKEKLAPDCFEYRNDDVKVLLNHETNPLNCLGSLKSKTAKIISDETGLFASVELPDTTAGRDIKTIIKRGDINKASIMFEVLDSTWEKIGGIDTETVTRAILWEISVVTFPAYETAEVSVRARERQNENIEKKKRAKIMETLKLKGLIKNECN
jgi:HK97 family phage prohead protease